MNSLIEINAESRIPKYKQVIDSVLENIKNGNLKMGDKIPSINQVSEECYLSRDTVEKAYSTLKSQKVIVAVKGKGYYITRIDLDVNVNVLFLINKLSSYKMRIFNSFVDHLGSDGNVELDIYHCEPSNFVKIIEKKKALYTHFVIMPHFKNESMQHIGVSSEIRKVLEGIKASRLIILDRDIKDFAEDAGRVVQDFRKDIYNALCNNIEKIQKYKKVILIYPSKSLYPYPKDILIGFRSFCLQHKFDFELLDEIYEGMEFQVKDLFIVIQESDLVNLVKQTRDRHYKLGDEIGIISYNDTPLKDLLGISVISTDFDQMGKLAAGMLLSDEKPHVKNQFRFIDRNSL